VGGGIAIGLQNARHPRQTGEVSVSVTENQLGFLNFGWARGSCGVICLLLGLCGGVAMLSKDRPSEPIKFNV